MVMETHFLSNEKEGNQDRDADRKDQRRKLGCVELETFDGKKLRTEIAGVITPSP